MLHVRPSFYASFIMTQDSSSDMSTAANEVMILGSAQDPMAEIGALLRSSDVE